MKRLKFRITNKKNMKIQLINCESAPQDMEAQMPITCTLMRTIPEARRADYWLAKCKKPVSYENVMVNYLVVAPRFVGDEIKKGMGQVVVGVAYVMDETLIQDDELNFDKCRYVAICTAKEL